MWDFALGFSFHRSKTAEGYQILLDTITQEAGIDFIGCTIESDQGMSIIVFLY